MELRNLRLLFVHSGSDLYGASRSLLRLSSHLVNDGATVQVVLPNEGPLVSALQEKGILVTIHRNLPVIERQRVGNLKGIVSLISRLFFSMFSLLKLSRQFKPQCGKVS